MTRPLLAALLALVSGAAITTTVVASGGAQARPPAPRALTATLDEWEIRTSSAVAARGRIELVEQNAGELEHELLIVRTGLAPDRLPRGLEGVKPSVAGTIVYGREHTHAAAGHADPAATARRHLRPGASKRTTVRLAPGRYVLLCSIPGHYEAGQSARLTVSAG